MGSTFQHTPSSIGILVIIQLKVSGIIDGLMNALAQLHALCHSLYACTVNVFVKEKEPLHWIEQIGMTAKIREFVNVLNTP